METLYNIFIMPLIYMLEVLIYILRPILSLNPICAVFIISFVVNFISYPIFAKIEQMIKADNEKYQKLLPKVNSIKRNFQGYERRMLLSTYFRQNDYHPLLAHFKQSLTIFLQVPIFIASYIVIRENGLFQNQILDQINNSINLFNIPIKVLPILMTIINVMSVRVYMKNKSLSSKIYANSLSIIFLVLLYFSPASIVLYWIFNNSFAFLRNVYFYAKNKIALTISCYVLAVVSLSIFIAPNINTIYSLMAIGFVFIAYKFVKYISKDTFYVLNFLCFLAIYIIMYNLGYISKNNVGIYYIIAIFLSIIGWLCYKFLVKENNIKLTIFDYVICQLPIVLIFFFYFPLKLVNSSIIEYMQVIDVTVLISHLFEVGLGLFVLYPLIIFYVQKSHRIKIYYFSLIFAIVSLLYFYVYKTLSNVINVYSVFEVSIHFSPIHSYLFEVLMISLIIFIASLMLRYRTIKYINIIAISLIIVYSYLIKQEINVLPKENEILQPQKENNNNKVTISTEGKNVLIILLDRAISGFLPKIMQEVPEFEDVFTGFVYYPYTVSHAIQTLYSTPSLLGGYEYTPQKLQNDKTRNIVDKHNEAVSVIPELFRKNGYNVTLYDVPYLNYNNRNAPIQYHKDITLLNKEYYMERKENVIQKIKRNSLYFIFFKMAPSIYKNKIYNKGKYFTDESVYNIRNFDLKRESDIFDGFINDLSVENTNTNNFVFINSKITHSPTVLTDNYEIIEDNMDKAEAQKIKEKMQKMEKNSNFSRILSHFSQSKSIDYTLHYNVNMFAYKKVKNLIQKLKANNAYDNTRIIIMSDHGWILADIDNVDLSISGNNSVLFIKDFNAKGKYTTNYEFMTTADVPYLSAIGIDKQMVNPLTNKKLTKEKNPGVDIITNHFVKWSPNQFKTNDRTYLYDEEAKYMHVDKNKIKELIKIKEGM